MNSDAESSGGTEMHCRLNSRRLIVILLIAWIAAGAVWFSTAKHGIGFNPDSFAYIQGAKDLRTGGLDSPSITLTKFPPLPALTILLLDIRPALLIGFHMLVMACNMLALAYWFTQVDASPWIGLPVLLVLGFTPELVFRHAMVMSEPVFLLLFQLALIATLRGRLSWALLFAALAPMQRYAGVTVIAACALYVAYTSHWRRGVLFGVLAIIPVALWMVRGALVGADSGREFLWHPITWNHLKTALFTLAGRFWLGPAAVALALLAYFTRDRLRALTIPPVVQLVGLFSMIYLVFLVVSISVMDFYTPLDSRILSPAHLCGWIMVVWFANRQAAYLTSRQKWLWGVAFGVVLAGFLVFGLVRTVQNYLYGVGLLRNIEPGYYDVVAALPDTLPTYTNDTAVLLVMGYVDEDLTLPPLREIPAKFNPINQIPDPAYETRFNQMIEAVRSGQAALIWFVERARSNTASLDEIKALLPSLDYQGLVVFGTF